MTKLKKRIIVAPINSEEEKPEEEEEKGLDLVRMCLRKIGSYPLLSYEEMTERFRAMEVLKKINKPKCFAAVEEIEEIKEELIIRNLRLVVNIAKRFRGRGLDFLDLIQEGTFGLLKAVDKYDWRIGSHFSTYATYWIRQTIIRAIQNKNRTIHLPVNKYDKIARLTKKEAELARSLGRLPEDEEVAEALGVDVAIVLDLRVIREIGVISYHSPAKAGENKLEDFLPSQEEGVEELISREQLKQSIGEILSTLSPKEEKVLRLRFGIDSKDGKGSTLEQVGIIFNLTRERIRQIERKALKKLRHPARLNKLLKNLGYD